MWLRSLGQKDPLEQGMATHSSPRAWSIPWTAATIHRVAKSQTQLKQLSTHAHICKYESSGQLPVRIKISAWKSRASADLTYPGDSVLQPLGAPSLCQTL